MQTKKIQKKKNKPAKNSLSLSSSSKIYTLLNSVSARLEQIDTKTEQVHTAMFDPESGLITKVSEIKQWKETKDKEEAKLEKKINDFETRLKAVETSSNDFGKIGKIMQWFAVAIAGAIISIGTAWIQTKIR